MTRSKSVYPALIAVLLSPMAANADFIDFEEFNPPINNLINLGTTDFSSNGYNFTNINGIFLIVDNGQSNVPNTGSNTLIMDGGNPASFVLSESSGAAFDLDSLLALESRNTTTGFFQYSSTAIDVLGTFAGGGTVFTTIVLDLFAQENNLLDAQAVTFSGWSGLSSVQFTGVGGVNSGYGFGLDDITVNATSVPEPGTLALLGIGLFGIGLSRRRKV